METRFLYKFQKWNLGSYRTYEEWKPCFVNPSFPARESSYRTYEEWKQHDKQCRHLSSFSSYRTYEEWKPKIKGIDISKGALFLPYLWGMETTDGNYFLVTERTFLPYLWGMETFWVAFKD